MNNDRIFITGKKKKELEKELDFLTNEGRRKIAKELDDAKALGDLSENAEYHQAREDQGRMEARITEIENILKNAEIIKKSKTGKIQVGSEVTLLRKDDNKELTYKLVGVQEIDILSGKISFSSPLGSAMIGKEAGESFEFKTPNDKIQKFKIKEVK